eukprot:bmy_22312T0
MYCKLEKDNVDIKMLIITDIIRSKLPGEHPEKQGSALFKKKPSWTSAPQPLLRRWGADRERLSPADVTTRRHLWCFLRWSRRKKKISRPQGRIATEHVGEWRMSPARRRAGGLGATCRPLRAEQDELQVVFAVFRFWNRCFLEKPSSQYSLNAQTADGSHCAVSDVEMQEHYDEFFEEVFTEMEEKYGEVEEMNVCDNLGDHLVGNVFRPLALLVNPGHHNWVVTHIFFLQYEPPYAGKFYPVRMTETTGTDSGFHNLGTPKRFPCYPGDLCTMDPAQESPLRVGSWYLGFAVAAEMFEWPAEGQHFPKLSAEQRRSSMFQAQRRVESLPGCWEERLLSRLGRDRKPSGGSKVVFSFTRSLTGDGRKGIWALCENAKFPMGRKQCVVLHYAFKKVISTAFVGGCGSNQRRGVRYTVCFQENGVGDESPMSPEKHTSLKAVH